MGTLARLRVNPRPSKNAITASPTPQTQVGIPDEALMVGATAGAAVNGEVAAPFDTVDDSARGRGFCSRCSSCSKARNFSGSANLIAGSVALGFAPSAEACEKLPLWASNSAYT